MEQKRRNSSRRISDLQRVLIPLVTIAVCLFVFLVIIENRGGQTDTIETKPSQQTAEVAPSKQDEEEKTPQQTEKEKSPLQTKETEPSQQTEEQPTEPVVVDITEPEIIGVEEILVYLGDTVSYRSGVTVIDDMDPAPKLSVDSSEVDLSTEGTYEVVYTAQDAAGNATSVYSTVKVLAKKEGYADVETIYAAADAVLEKIITEDMSTRKQVKAIYNWARTSFGYSGSSDKSDWLQGAYVMLTKKTGDCFNYFAVCKLLFERLGIPNIDVQKVKNYKGDSAHYWSLVSIDGGENYYHFDATPRKGDGDNFCLVTDAFLDKYSKAHHGSHNRDKSLYPATPKEALS